MGYHPATTSIPGAVAERSRPALWTRLVLLLSDRPARHYLVDQAELLGLDGRHELVALHRLGDDLERLSRMFNVHLVETCPKLQDFSRLDFNIRRLALGAARGLV